MKSFTLFNRVCVVAELFTISDKMGSHLIEAIARIITIQANKLKSISRLHKQIVLNARFQRSN